MEDFLCVLLRQWQLLRELCTHTSFINIQDNRPRFHGRDGLADGRVLLYIDGTVDRPVPDRRLIGPVHHVNLDLNCSREDGVAAVLGDGLQAVALPLEGEGG